MNAFRNHIVAVGEAPNATAVRLKRRGLILTGPTGRNLAELLGVSWHWYLRYVDRVNLSPVWRPTLPRQELRRTAEALKPVLAGKLVLLLGYEVQRAFDLEAAGFRLRACERSVVPFVCGYRPDGKHGIPARPAYFLPLPHTSPRNPYWRDAEKCSIGRQRLRAAVDEHLKQRCNVPIVRCLQCGLLRQAGRPTRRRYCGSACRTAAWRERERER